MKNKRTEKKAALALESGLIYFGESFGAEGERYGEIVFNTSMTGYQEILTDPSYKGQIVVMTQPHIGNVGVNSEDSESSQIFSEGLVVREVSDLRSNWRSSESLSEFLIARNILAISGIDSRSITKHIRTVGAMRSMISTIDFNPESLIKKVKNSPLMAGQDLTKSVTCAQPYEWKIPEWKWMDSVSKLQNPKSKNQKLPFEVVVIDFGVKQNILCSLAERKCKVIVVPAQTSAEEIFMMKPDGILLSNGPGDPAAATDAIETIKKLMGSQIPIFGICLGHQLLGLALGGKTFKLKFGHRGANHPVKDLMTNKVEITTQNHGFCVEIDSLINKEIEITHINLNDHTLEGMRHKKYPIFSVQYHPESSAGPHDSRYLFDRFIELMKKKKAT